MVVVRGLASYRVGGRWSLAVKSYVPFPYATQLLCEAAMCLYGHRTLLRAINDANTSRSGKDFAKRCRGFFANMTSRERLLGLPPMPQRREFPPDLRNVLL